MLRLTVPALAALAIGCGDETGILIEVQRAEGVEAPDELRFAVGTRPMGGDRVTFFDDAPASGVVDIKGRDLDADPFRLLLEPSDVREREVMVAVVGMRSGQQVGFGSLPEPVAFVEGSVLKWTITLEAERVDAEATCLTVSVADGGTVQIGTASDRDCDGYTRADDCDDLNAEVHPGAGEVCGNQIDDDCNPETTDDSDADMDEFTVCGGDCNDQVASINPDANEVCDGVDNDCNGMCDELDDPDGDRYTACGSYLADDGSCDLDPEKWTDCDPENASVHPGHDEECDGLDNDCNGACDDDESFDNDGDGVTVCGSAVGLCGIAEADCDDDDRARYPGATERCDSVDNDCDGIAAALVPCVTTVEGACRAGTVACTEDLVGTPVETGVCQATIEDRTVPDELCAAADLCLENGDSSDGLQCAFADAGAFACHAYVVDGQVCANHTAALPGGVAPCAWQVLFPPGDGWSIGLVETADDAADPQAAADVCDPYLSAVLATAGSQTELYLSQTSDGGVHFFRGVVTASEVEDCPAQGGFVCVSVNAASP